MQEAFTCRFCTCAKRNQGHPEGAALGMICFDVEPKTPIIVSGNG